MRDLAALLKPFEALEPPLSDSEYDALHAWLLAAVHGFQDARKGSLEIGQYVILVGFGYIGRVAAIRVGASAAAHEYLVKWNYDTLNVPMQWYNANELTKCQ